MQKNVATLKGKLAKLEKEHERLQVEFEQYKRESVTMGKVKEIKTDVNYHLILMYQNMGIDKPENHDDILEFVVNDVMETADPENWHSGDVAIAFRRWIEIK